MSEGKKWTPGKIFLLVLGILAGLGILCCGAGYLLLGDKIQAGVAFTKDSIAFEQRLKTDYGQTATSDVKQNDRGEFVLAIGAEGELTPERVAEIQEGAWRTFGEIFGKDGFFPVKHVAVGRPVTGGGRGKGGAKVVDWGGNMVSAEELVKRTGVPIPPLAKFLPAEFDGSVVQVKVSTGDSEKPDGKGKEEEGKDEEDDGGGTGGK